MSAPCWASMAADAHAAALGAADLHGERVEAEFDSALESLLSGTEATDLDYTVINALGPELSAQKLLADRDASGWNNWFRLLMLAPVKDSAEVLLNFQRWARATLACDKSAREQILAEAERLVEKADEQAREDAALFRAAVYA